MYINTPGSTFVHQHIWINICTSSHLDPHLYIITPGSTFVHHHTWVHNCTSSHLDQHLYIITPGSTFVHQHIWIHICTSSHLDPHLYIITPGSTFVYHHTWINICISIYLVIPELIGHIFSSFLSKLIHLRTRHVFVKHGCPRQQQSQNMAKISKSYIFDPTHPQGHGMLVKCETPIDEHTVQVWLLYHHPNFKYCTL